MLKEYLVYADDTFGICKFITRDEISPIGGLKNADGDTFWHVNAKDLTFLGTKSKIFKGNYVDFLK